MTTESLSVTMFRAIFTGLAVKTQRENALTVWRTLEHSGIKPAELKIDRELVSLGLAEIEDGVTIYGPRD